jgi:hypothetical protein
MLSRIDQWQLGRLGEQLPLNPRVTQLWDLNAYHGNFPVFDYLAEIDSRPWAISVKARRRFTQSGRENTQYNILTGSRDRARKFQKAVTLLENMGWDPRQLGWSWLVAPMENHRDVIYYWGTFDSVNPRFCLETGLTGTAGNVYVPVRAHQLADYTQWGTRSWSELWENF